MDTMSARRFLFVTANKNETEALLKCGDDGRFFKYSHLRQSDVPHDPNFYNIGKFGCYDVVHFQLQDQGTVQSGSANLAISAAIDAFKPAGVVLVGVGFGTDDADGDRQKIGDVLVSKRVCDYGSGELDNDRFIHDGSIVDAGQHLVSAMTNYSQFWEYMIDGIKSSCFVGDVLSGEIFVNNSEFKKHLLRQYPWAIGGEMEGRGAYAACRSRGVQEWVIVKGICDWGDGRAQNDKPKKNNDQRVAARAAVSLLMRVFSDPHSLSKIPPHRDLIGQAETRNQIDVLRDSSIEDFHRYVAGSHGSRYREVSNKPESLDLVLYGKTQDMEAIAVNARYYEFIGGLTKEDIANVQDVNSTEHKLVKKAIKKNVYLENTLSLLEGDFSVLPRGEIFRYLMRVGLGSRSRDSILAAAALETSWMSIYNSQKYANHKDEAIVRKCLLRIAERSDEVGVFARNAAGKCYLEGRMYKDAKEMFMMAAREGNLESEYWIGIIYYSGLGVTKDTMEAISHLQRASRGKEKRVAAMRTLAKIYEDGDGVDRDETKSADWLLKASAYEEDGVKLSKMQNAIGDICIEKGTEAGYKEAYAWYTAASQSGNTIAMINLAYMYSEGMGVIQDDEMSLEWIRMSANCGNDYAKKMIARQNSGQERISINAS